MGGLQKDGMIKTFSALVFDVTRVKMQEAGCIKILVIFYK